LDTDTVLVRIVQPFVFGVRKAQSYWMKANPYHMSMSPHMYASAYQNNYDYYASQEVDPSSNMIVPFEHQTQMVEQFEPTPYPYPMNILQGEVPYPYGMVPYMPPIDDLQVVEEVEMGILDEGSTS
jgi:hypothetical protein